MKLKCPGLKVPFTHGVEKFIVEEFLADKLSVEKFMVEKFMVEEFMVEKSGVEMSCNLYFHLTMKLHTNEYIQHEDCHIAKTPEKARHCL
jgi:hypothetical protein